MLHADKHIQKGSLMITPSTKTNVSPPQTSPARNCNSIDLFKFICSILVFCVHIPLFDGDISPVMHYLNFGIQHYLARIAVPFFFVSSGYFLFRKMTLDHLDYERIKSYCFKILRLYATWNILLVFGGTTQLWYLSATVVAIILLSICFHLRFSFRRIGFIAATLYIIGLLGDSYYGIVSPLTAHRWIDLLFKAYTHVFHTTRNGLFMGFIFILMGASFAHKENLPKPKQSLIAFLCSMMLLFAEVFTLEHFDLPVDHNMYLSLLPAVYFLFSLVLQIDLKDRPIFKRLRTMGLWIYFTHLLLDRCVRLALSAANQLFGFHMFQLRFLLGLIVTLAFSFAAETLSRKKRFNWLNYLLS